MAVIKIPCVYMRGGTSKACIFHEKDLPADRSLWKDLFLKVMGTPDVKQIDGMGGTVSSTSKIAVIKKSERDDADVDYTFFQVFIDRPIVGDKMNCGNISSAVGPFAINEGLIPAVEPITVVRIYNTNTDKLLEAHVRVKDGLAMEYGDAQIQGVPGTGSPIDMFFVRPTGAGTGKTFPTGKRKELLEIPGYAPIEATMFDCANPAVFIRAADMGLSGKEHVALNNDPAILAHFERIRAVAAERMGLAASYQEATEKGIGPLIAFLSPSQEYTGLDGDTYQADQMSICCRGLNAGKVHRAYPMSLGVATAAACRLEGTIPYELAKKTESTIVDLGHASGITTFDVRLDTNGDIEKVGFIRTARRIMQGYVYIRE